MCHNYSFVAIQVYNMFIINIMVKVKNNDYLQIALTTSLSNLLASSSERFGLCRHSFGITGRLVAQYTLFWRNIIGLGPKEAK